MSEIVKVKEVPDQSERQQRESFSFDLCKAIKGMDVGDVIELPLKRYATVVLAKLCASQFLGHRFTVTSIKRTEKCYLRRDA